MPTPIPAIGTISDPTKVRVALMQGDQAVNGPPLSVVADAVGVPSGGTTGQVLTKSSGADYDNEWADIPTQGDLSGPASAVDGNFAAFDGTTGKLVKDSGKKASDFQTALGYTPANVAGDTFTGAVNFDANLNFSTPGSDGQRIVWTDSTNNTSVFAGLYFEQLRIFGIYRGGGAAIICYLDPQTGKILLTGDPTAALGAATKQYVDALPLAKSYESAQQTITSGGALSLTHGLGDKPKLYQAFLVNVTAEAGYSAGDEVAINPHISMQNTSSRGVSLVPTSTTIGVRFGADANAILILRKDTGASFTVTNANWKLIVRAWL